MLGGCASGRPADGVVFVGPPDDTSGSYDRQALYRVDVDGPEGEGRLKLVLRDGDDGFQLLASDPFGRALWVLTRRAGMTWLIDHRGAAWCRSANGVSLPELELSGLPIDRIPGILEGQPPAAIPDGSAGGPFEDSAGRWWSVSEDADGLRAWTLWQDGEPVLWWQRQARGGILSHRRGSQFRWRRSVAEETPGSIFRVTIPEGYHELDCAAWDLP